MELRLYFNNKKQIPFMDPPDQVGQKHLCQQADQFGKEKFKLGMTGEGDDNQESTKEVVDQAGKKNTTG